ncbi:uncharacterized protein LOC110990393 [Acanthaster planci]|uniref:Uncharacterized protein LOC110990393 n=1 Tax=Acanthaster planci TaxID=133434 RepID=A0A8B8A560_ACAPL|nr:uncharacterized protein LOC110990393 [Acanthaster planci]
MRPPPRAIAATSTGNRLVVVGEKAFHVKVFDKDNTLAFQFPTVPPSEVGKTAVKLQSVAVKTDGTIVVGDIERMVLTEHSPTDGELRSTIPVKIKPYFLAVDSNDRVVISDSTWASSMSRTVGIVDGNGDTKFPITPTIEGQPVAMCSNVCTGGTDIYVAMYKGDHNGCIYRYNPQGGILRRVVQGLYRPRGITFTADGQLAVADTYSLKIFQKV